jgi:hypothetical protein
MFAVTWGERERNRGNRDREREKEGGGKKIFTNMDSPIGERHDTAAKSNDPAEASTDVR